MQPSKEKASSPKARRGHNRDFELLRLRPNESQSAVIRQAAERQVKRQWELRRSIWKDANGTADVAALLTAAYRLLDPRRRRMLRERIQLTYDLLAESHTEAALLSQSAAAVENADEASWRASSARSDKAGTDAGSDPSLAELREILAIVRSAADDVRVSA